MLFERLARWLERDRHWRPADPLGRRGEELAADHLRRAGLRIIERNFTCRAGEIDLVAREGDVLVFVEVKARASDNPPPEHAVNRRKRRQITRAALIYQKQLKVPTLARFDIVAVVLPPGGEPVIRHHRAAFPAEK